MDKVKTERIGKTDGRLFRVERDDVFPGTVLRMVQSDGSSAPFSDLTVLSVRTVEELDGRPLGSPFQEVTMCRPYLRSAPDGSALTGVETVRVDVGSLLREDSQFRVLATARGRVCEHGF